MIVVETLLGEVFSQIPDVVVDSKPYKVKYEWGNLNDLGLYMQTESGNTTPLIWLIEGEDSDNEESHSLERRVRLMVAKSSENKTSRNPTVWRLEFETVLIPLFKNVLTCLIKSGVTTIVGGEYKKTLRANYSEFERSSGADSGSSNTTIDHWNVIVFDGLVKFTEKADGTPNCINQIRF